MPTISSLTRCLSSTFFAAVVFFLGVGGVPATAMVEFDDTTSRLCFLLVRYLQFRPSLNEALKEALVQAREEIDKTLQSCSPPAAACQDDDTNARAPIAKRSLESQAPEDIGGSSNATVVTLKPRRKATAMRIDEEKKALFKAGMATLLW